MNKVQQIIEEAFPEEPNPETEAVETETKAVKAKPLPVPADEPEVASKKASAPAVAKQAPVAGIGHNNTNRLALAMKEIDKLEEAKAQLNEKAKSIYAELRSIGYATGPIKAVRKLQKLEPSEQQNYIQDMIIVDEATNQGTLFELFLDRAKRDESSKLFQAKELQAGTIAPDTTAADIAKKTKAAEKKKAKK